MSLDSASSQKDAGAGPAAGPMHQVMGRRWMVAAGHPLAAQAAAHILEAGGNVFREKCGGQIPVGLLRTVVPAAPDAWCAALERWGTKSFGETVAPALECAEHGFPLSVFSAYQLGRAADKIRRFPTSAAVYLKDGQGPPAGHLLVEAELAQTIKIMVAAEVKSRARGRAGAIRAARDSFYKGEIALRIADYHAREGGLLTTEDLADFSVEIAPALKTPFGDYEIASCGFWCQGPVLLQMMNLIEGYDWPTLGHNTPRALHILTEAMKLAFADREAYYGDPLYVKVPADGLLSKEYARARRALIREDRAWPDLPPAGDPLGLRATANGGHGVSGPITLRPEGSLDTSYVCVVDAEGNAFSATPSDPGVDSPLIPGVGCVVSPRGSQGWLSPGHPSLVAGGKRPRLTPAPAMVLRDGRAFMPIGTPGGDVQQQAILQVFLNVTAHGMAPQQAIEAPRIATRSFPDSFWPHVHAPGVLEAEARVSPETRAALGALGHSMAAWPDWDWRAGAVCCVVVGPDGVFRGGADPRRGALAIGW